MALDAFKTAFSNTYQEVFQKMLVAMKIANTRLQSDLVYGSSVERVKYDIGTVRVRDIVIGSDMTIDSVTDTSESLLVNYHKGTGFALNEKEVKQAGPLSPGQIIGAKIAHQLSLKVDAYVLYETVNAEFDFDNGDLTTLTSTGTAITLSSTTVPQLMMRLNSKLAQRNNIMTDSNMCMVIDPYMLGDIGQYLLGKNADYVLGMATNGYKGDYITGAQVYMSNSLTGEAVLGLATEPTANDTVVINGVTFTFVATPTDPGDVDLGGSADTTRANLTAAINGGAGAGTAYIEVSSANRILLSDTLEITATNNNTTNKMTIVGKGSGRFILSETFTDATDAWDKNFVHVYYGKKGAIDVVIQKDVDIDVRQEPKQKASNYLSSVIFGVKTFSDGAKQFLDVLINA